MASGRDFRRRQRAGEHSLDVTEGLALENGSPAEASQDDSFIQLKELLANSDHDGVRLDKLARAQQLVADGNYPPKEVLESVATLLARHLQPGAEG
jgi:hypothetical protein